jgi:tRNA(fMet)-specific endonuclease VapC
MSYLLDTNAVIALMKKHPQMLQFVRRVGLSRLLLCAPVEAELWFGVYKSTRSEENR